MTKHFTLEEFIKSKKADELGIDNTPPESILSDINMTAAGMERIRAFLGSKPIKITSGFRCKSLNDAINGSKDSQHMKGQAVDFICPSFGSPRDIAVALSSNLRVIGIDQLILEPGWIHVSFVLNPRYQALTLKNGKYLRGIS